MKSPALIAAAAVPLFAGMALAASPPATSAELRATAQCMVSEDAKSVRELLQTLPGSDAEARVAKHMGETYTACSGGTILLVINRNTQGLYNGRAELAAAVVARQGGIDVASATTLAPWYVQRIVGRSPGRDYDGVSLGMQEFGTCVVKAAPEASLRFVKAPAGSAEEGKALDGIKPVLAGCVVAGKPLSMKREHLRLMIAEPLYHAIVDGPAAGRRS